MKKAESQADGLFPGDVGNMERSKNYRDMDKYHTFEQSVNYELPDMRHEWKEDKRDENNIPVPKVAELYAAAQNAIKLSMMFLGDNAPQKMVQAQARDFMKLGNSRLVASINRWIETEEDETVEEPAATEETVEVPAPEAVPAPAVADETEEVAPATEETVADETVEAPATEEADETEEVADEEVMEETEEAPAAEADEEEITLEEDNVGDLNTEVDFSTVEETEEVEADEDLESIFEDDMAEDDNNEVVARAASKKQGIKRIAGQPKLVRVASSKIDELEGLWSKLDRPVI
jgi:chemotaxis protein histidine kinase CheA